MSPESFLPPEISGWNLSKDIQTYDRNSIFDYINGAGEVYRSYDFQSVLVAQYRNPPRPGITVEIFNMGTPEDAYGIFSYSRESESSGVGMAYEYRGTLLSFWQNRYYVCILGEKPETLVKETAFNLAKLMTQKIPEPGKRPELIDILPEDGLIQFSERYFHLHPSLNYHYYLADDNILKLGPQTNAVLARYKPGAVFLLCVQYDTREAVTEAHASFIRNYIPEASTRSMVETQPDKYTGIRYYQDYLVIVLDAVTEEMAIDMTDTVMEKLSVTPK